MLQGLRCLARGIDVELALEDVVNYGLAEVIHDMSVPMLQGQSGEVGEEDGSEGLRGPFPGLTRAGNTVVSP